MLYINAVYYYCKILQTLTLRSFVHALRAMTFFSSTKPPAKNTLRPKEQIHQLR